MILPTFFSLTTKKICVYMNTMGRILFCWISRFSFSTQIIIYYQRNGGIRAHVLWERTRFLWRPIIPHFSHHHRSKLSSTWYPPHTNTTHPSSYQPSRSVSRSTRTKTTLMLLSFLKSQIISRNSAFLWVWQIGKVFRIIFREYRCRCPWK